MVIRRGLGVWTGVEQWEEVTGERYRQVAVRRRDLRFHERGSPGLCPICDVLEHCWRLCSRFVGGSREGLRDCMAARLSVIGCWAPHVHGFWFLVWEAGRLGAGLAEIRLLGPGIDLLLPPHICPLICANSLASLLLPSALCCQTSLYPNVTSTHGRPRCP